MLILRLLEPRLQNIFQRCGISILCSCHKQDSRDARITTSHPRENKSYTVCHKWKMYHLKSRSIVRLAGRDVIPFLQGLMTNDVSLLGSEQEAQYTMMLNAQGRVLYDLFLYNYKKDAEGSCVFCECDHQVTSDLIKLLKKYKIRKKVDISDVSDELKTFAALPSETTDEGKLLQCTEMDEILLSPDPRLDVLGWRIIASNHSSLISGLHSDIDMEVFDDEKDYHIRRYQLGVPEGTLDLPPGNSLPLESNLIFHNGVSFTKGCYIGQELTARTHHTGVTRKRLMPIQFDRIPENIQPGDSIETDSKKNAGKYRNSIDRYGLALLRLANARGQLNIKSSDGQNYNVCATFPKWWPQEGEVDVRL